MINRGRLGFFASHEIEQLVDFRLDVLSEVVQVACHGFSLRVSLVDTLYHRMPLSTTHLKRTQMVYQQSHKVFEMKLFQMMRGVVLFMLFQLPLQWPKQGVESGILGLLRVVRLSHCSPPDEMKWLPSLPHDSLIVNVPRIVGYPDSIGRGA
jgi:hypothetical protein